MASIAEIMQLCRLCLVKEQVNVPIFEEQGDIRQIFLKITACLPVKISREDNLPKKICNGCLYKLELLYQFWNTSTNAEKQLLSWLTAAGLDATTQTTQDAMAVVTQTQVVLKQEPNPEITENVTVVSDPGNFILQAAQQPIEFPAVDFDYQDNFTAEQELANNAISADVDDSTESEPVAKRPRRTATATVTAPLIESEDDADDPGEAAVAAKTEEDSDDDTNVEPTFVDVAEDQDGEQPGPSGLGKIVEPSLKVIPRTILKSAVVGTGEVHSTANNPSRLTVTPKEVPPEVADVLRRRKEIVNPSTEEYMQWMMDSQMVLIQLALNNCIDTKSDSQTNHRTSTKLALAPEELGGVEGIAAKYGMHLPLRNMEDFDVFEMKMTEDSEFSADVKASLHIYLDSGGSISKSISSMLRAYICKGLGLEFTASQPVVGKRVMKSTKLFCSITGVIVQQRSALKLETKRADLTFQLGRVLNNVKRWTMTNSGFLGTKNKADKKSEVRLEQAIFQSADEEIGNSNGIEYT